MLRFDRGTLLVQGPDIPQLAETLVELAWDPRASTYRVPAYRYRDVVERRSGSALQPSDATRQITAERPALRPYQEIALAAWRAGGHRGLVVLPTGAGKTHVGLAAIAETKTPALVITPTRILLHQWVERAREVLQCRVGVLGDGERQLEAVTIATFASATKWMPRIGNQFPLLVVDEAHHFGGAQTEALEMSVAPFRLGLTATPPDTEDATANLDRVIGPVVSEVSLGELTGTYLAPFDHHVLKLPLTAEERSTYDACLRSFRRAKAIAEELLRANPVKGPQRWARLMHHMAAVPGGPAAVQSFRRAESLVAYTEAKSFALGALLERHRGQRALVFAADNASVYRIAREHLLWPITCDIGRAERAAALAHFASGELRGLCSAQVLNEGYDVPDASLAIVVGARRGLREQVQRIGRVLRPGPGKKATLYELVAAETFEERRSARRALPLRPLPERAQSKESA